MVVSIRKYLWCLSVVCALGYSCSTEKGNGDQSSHKDQSYQQDYSIKYVTADSSTSVYQVASDRNGVVQILSSKGLLHPFAGEMLYPGSLVPDDSYRPMKDKKISAIAVYRNQLVYLDDKAVLSNAWAGALYTKHNLPGAKVFAGGSDFDFLISDGQSFQYVKKEDVLWENKSNEQVLNMLYDSIGKRFLVLTPAQIFSFATAEKKYSSFFTSDSLTCFTLANNGRDLVVGTTNGYIVVDAATGKAKSDINRKLPWNALTAVAEIDGKLWFGSAKGAFMLTDEGKFNYYASKRWLPSDDVKYIVRGDNGSVLILTGSGLGKIAFTSMTLEQKAAFYDKQVRLRHIRNGFNATLSGMTAGNLGTGHLEDSDNDGLWTSMYLGAEAFRYVVTQSPDALQNCRESLDAMERLYTINSLKGFPSRSFERRGYRLHDPERWIPAKDPEWDWKSTTSSDEAIGHVFVFAVIAELVDDAAIKTKAIRLLDTLMQHIVDNDFYMIDWDGKPTLWGKWNPDYVNARPKNVGDRKINSSNIIAMLQTAYHFTKKEIYKEKAFDLMNKHGYLENLMRPMKEIGHAPDDADDWSKMLSEGWNHSDDEMYFLGYWGLYRYAFNDTLKQKYKEAIIDHWEIERPEKEGAWNIFTALTGAKEFDLKEAIWYLQEYPLDMIDWRIHNSARKDIELIAPNFRGQTVKEVLPPDELPVRRHNANRFGLDGGSNGNNEHSAGDIWLLPYWMGRYLGVIDAPAK